MTKTHNRWHISPRGRQIVLLCCLLALIGVFFLFFNPKDRAEDSLRYGRIPILWGYPSHSETNCHDGVDNDSDGVTDCDDDDCASSSACTGGA